MASSNTDLLSSQCTAKAPATAHPHLNLAMVSLRMDSRAMEAIHSRDTRSKVMLSRDMRSLDMEVVMGVVISSSSRDRRRVEVLERLGVRRWAWEVV